MKKTLAAVLALAVCAGSRPAAGQALPSGKGADLKPLVSSILDRFPAETSAARDAVCAEILKLGPAAVREACARVLAPGAGDDAKARFSVNGLAVYVTRPGAESERVLGADKGKLIPNDVAMLVNDFLLVNFPQIMDYQFTAHIEDELDEIANGKMDYHEMLDEFYTPFKEKVDHTIETSVRVSGERILGTDPATGKQVSVRMARFGPVAALSNPKDENDKPIYAGLRKTQKLENITFEEAMQLFKLPRVVGLYNDREVVAAIGRFGPYVKYDGKFYSIKNQYDPHDIEIDEAIGAIEAKIKSDAEKLIKTFDENLEFQILNGRWGPYLKAGKENVKIPKDREPSSLTYDECLKLVEEAKSIPKRRGRFSRSKT